MEYCFVGLALSTIEVFYSAFFVCPFFGAFELHGAFLTQNRQQSEPFLILPILICILVSPGHGIVHRVGTFNDGGICGTFFILPAFI